MKSSLLRIYYLLFIVVGGLFQRPQVKIIVYPCVCYQNERNNGFEFCLDIQVRKFSNIYIPFPVLI